MPHFVPTTFIATLFSIIGATTLSASDLSVAQQFSRATSPAMKNGAVFMVVNNASDQDRKLVAAQTDVAKTAELHTHTMDDQGIMRMREVEGGIDVPAGMKNVLQPGGYHVMLMGLNGALKKGSVFDLTLTFDNGETLTVSVPVKSAGAMVPMTEMDNTLHGSSNKATLNNQDHDQAHQGPSSKSGSGHK